jgi:inhibitor of KinA
MNNFSIFPLGDQAVTFSLSATIKEEYHVRVMAMKTWLLENSFHGLKDVIVAYSSLTLLYDACQVRKTFHVESPSLFAMNKLREAHRQTEYSAVSIEPKLLRIPVCYEPPFSPDLETVSALTGIAEEHIIRMHSEKKYRVYMIGFLPGFPYLGEVDQRIVVPRKTTPRQKVEAGSVGIAGSQTGVYPLDSPGGWQIIGKTPFRLFEKNAVPPVILEPGNSVEFYPITRKEFENFTQQS